MRQRPEPFPSSGILPYTSPMIGGPDTMKMGNNGLLWLESIETGQVFGDKFEGILMPFLPDRISADAHIQS
jgi:hypothetical protein